MAEDRGSGVVSLQSMPHRSPGPGDLRPPGRPVRALVLLLAVAACTAAAAGRAAAADPFGAALPFVKPYRDAEGLPQNTINALALDREGLLWAGTQDGVARYDGRRWESVELPVARRTRHVRCLYTDRSGALWFGTQGAGLVRLDEAGWRVFSSSPGGLPGERVNALTETGFGGRRELWVALHDEGLAAFDGSAWRRFTTAEGLPAERVWDLLPPASADDDSLWIATAAGLARLRLGSGRIEPLVGAPAVAFSSLARTRDAAGREILWAGSYGEGLFRFADGAWTRFGRAEGLRSNFLTDLEPRPDGRNAIWIATDGGGIAELEGDRVRAIDLGPLFDSGAAYRLLETTDAQGGAALWVGTRNNGLLRVSEGLWRVVHPVAEAPAATASALLVRPDGADGIELWAGLDGRGLALWRQGTWRRFDRASGALANDTVLALAETRHIGGGPRVWAGTRNGGLASWDGTRWSRFDRAGGALPHDLVQSLLEVTQRDGTGRLWVGTRGGAVVFDGQPLADAARPRLGGRLDPRAGRAGAAAHGRGADDLARHLAGALALSRRPPAQLGHRRRPAQRLRPGAPSAAARHAGVALGRHRRGPRPPRPARRGTPRHDRPRPRRSAAPQRLRLRHRGGPRRPAVHSHQPRRGAADVERDERDARHPAVHDRARPAAQPGHARRRAGRPARARLDRHRRRHRGDRPRARDRRHRPRAPAADRRVESRPGPAPDADARLVRGEGRLVFHYSLLSFVGEPLTAYRTQLVGLERLPTDWTAAAEREISELEPGRYRFLVWARDGMGQEVGPAEVAFTIVPTPWETLPVRLALAALVLLLFWLAARLWVARHERRERELEARVAARTRELAEVNEQLSRLSRLDTLTGLPNRRQFEVTLEAEWTRSMRADRPLAVVMLDVDDFKVLNDSQGHPAGDECLRRVARALAEALPREGDLLARWAARSSPSSCRRPTPRAPVRSPSGCARRSRPSSSPPTRTVRGRGSPRAAASPRRWREWACGGTPSSARRIARSTAPSMRARTGSRSTPGPRALLSRSAGSTARPRARRLARAADDPDRAGRPRRACSPGSRRSRPSSTSSNSSSSRSALVADDQQDLAVQSPGPQRNQLLCAEIAGGRTSSRPKYSTAPASP